MSKINSPYSAAFTGCSFMLYEMNRMLPLFLDSHSEELTRREIDENNILMVNSLASRKRYIAELKRRFSSVPVSFWTEYQTWEEPAQRIGILYVLLKTYRMVLDFHLNVTLKKWKSIDHHVTYEDILTELSEIAANDAFVDSWSETTKKKVASYYITYLIHAGISDKKTFEIKPANGVTASDYAYYINIGEEWFLEACLLYPYEIENIKTIAR